MVQREGEVQEEDLAGGVGSMGLLEPVVDERDSTGSEEQGNEGKNGVARCL